MNFGNLQKIPQSEYFRNRCSVKNFVWFFSFILLCLFCLLIFTSLLIFISLQSGIISVINPNRIILPDGKFLHDLSTFTFRNRTLYRYNNQYIILAENDNFETVSFMSEENMDDVVVITSVPHDGEYEVSARGRCDCFVEEEENGRKSLGNLVFSRHYVSVIVVSVLGYAFAKFVDVNIDDCYEKAKNILGSEDELPFTCSIHDFEVDGRKAKIYELKPEVKKVQRGTVKFECDGHCLEKGPNQYHLELGWAEGMLMKKNIKEAILEMECEESFAGGQVIEVNPEDPAPTQSFKENGQYVVRKDLVAVAFEKYRSRFLEPFCESLVTKYWTTHSDGTKEVIPLKPCSAHPKARLDASFPRWYSMILCLPLSPAE